MALDMPANLPPAPPPIPSVERAVESPRKASPELARVNVSNSSAPPPKDPSQDKTIKSKTAAKPIIAGVFVTKVVANGPVGVSTEQYRSLHAKSKRASEPGVIPKRVPKPRKSVYAIFEKSPSNEASSVEKFLDDKNIVKSVEFDRLSFVEPVYSELPEPVPDAYTDDGRKKKDILREKEISALFIACKALGIPEGKQDEWVRDALIRADKAKRPKWADRLSRNDADGNEIWTLTAPNFLKRVHRDYIGEDGTVHNGDIRTLDTDLMTAIEQYISKRRNRQQDLGDAKGLKFVFERPQTAAFYQARRQATPT